MGVTATHSDPSEMYYADEDDGLAKRCGGLGVLRCYCGGDLCLCGNFGEAECYGCPDCEDVDDEGDWL